MNPNFRYSGVEIRSAKSVTVIFFILLFGITFHSRALTIHLDTVYGSPGDSITFGLLVQDLDEAGSFTLYIEYNESVLQWGRALNWHEQLLDGVHMANASGGILAVIWFDAGGATIDNGVLADLRFRFLGGASSLVFSVQSEVTDRWGNLYSPPPLFIDGAVFQKITVAATALPPTLCMGDSSWLQASVTGGHGNTQYTWSSVPPGFSSTLPGVFAIPDTSSLYVVQVTDGFDASADTVTVEIYDDIPPVAVSSMFPADGSVNLSLPLIISWNSTLYTTTYDLYIWPDGEPEPDVPFVEGLHQISYLIDNIIEYGSTYHWRVVSVNPCLTTPGPVYTFSVRNLPDLIVSNITAPAHAYSGHSFTLSYEVKNQGQGSTMMTDWKDYIYISTDSILNPGIDYFLGAFSNMTYLEGNQSYVQSPDLMMPQGYAGDYYLFIWTDKTGKVAETIEYNNKGRTSSPLPVYLSPTPDLQVSEIIAPANTFSGQEINVSWKVTNHGLVSTSGQVWHDRVYLSTDTSLTGDVSILGTYLHTGLLAADSFYTVFQTLVIPKNIYGPHYLIIKTDIYNTVYEHALESNNSRSSDTLNIILTPPPDLAVTEITLPDSASNFESIMINYTVENKGSNPTDEFWQDNIYISGSSVFSLQTSTWLGQYRYRSLPLEPGQSYSNAIPVRIPRTSAGQQYLYVFTDCDDNVFEHTFEENNIGRSEDAITILNADIVPQSLWLPDTLWSGLSFNGSYWIKNYGPGKLLTSWNEKIYLSGSPVFDSGDTTHLVTINHTGIFLNPGDSLEVEFSARLPYEIEGIHYLHLMADADTVVNEGVNEDNNWIISLPFYINFSPWPDLVVEWLDLGTDTATAGLPLSLSYSVVNVGEGVTLNSSWKDRVLLSADGSSPVGATSLAQVDHQGSLLPDSGYITETEVVIPPSTPEGVYYCWIVTDNKGMVWEYTAEDNNFLRSEPLYVKPYPPVDLVCTGITAPLSAASGAQFPVSWSAMNQGSVPTTEFFWKDWLYFSADTFCSTPTDYPAGSTTHYGNVPAYGTYEGNATFTVPNGIGGNYYVYMYLDRDNKNHDADPGNNVGFLRDGNGDPQLVHVDFTIPPDLVPVGHTGESILTAGQPAAYTFTIENQGDGPVNTQEWYDYLYLSPDFLPDKADMVLAQKIQHPPLMPGDSLEYTIVADIPSNYEGNSIMILQLDKSDKVYEHDGEGNNLLVIPVTILQSPPSDLTVTQVIAPMTVSAGDSVDISWTVKNVGENPATGLMKEILYLSSDTVWDINDIVVGSVTASISIGNGASETHSLRGFTGAVPMGRYHFIVRTDVLNNITESNEANNMSFADQSTEVKVPELQLNSWLSGVLSNHLAKFYRIEIPPGLNGETLLLLLQGDSVYGNNELYLKYGDTPDRNTYDYAYGTANFGNQEIIVPNLIAGTWYVMVYGYTLSGIEQSFRLFARIMSFEILSVQANTGGQGGRVTVKLTGSKFSADMKVSLVRGESIIGAESLNFISVSQVYVTFSLLSADTGWYNVLAQKFCEGMVVKQEAFHVVPASAPDLMVDMKCPSTTFPGFTAIVRVEYLNNGNNDLEVPWVEFLSNEEAPISFDLPGLSLGQSGLLLHFTELYGPQSILRPGAGGTIIIYAKAGKGLAFSLEIPDFE